MSVRVGGRKSQFTIQIMTKVQLIGFDPLDSELFRQHLREVCPEDMVDVDVYEHVPLYTYGRPRIVINSDDVHAPYRAEDIAQLLMSVANDSERLRHCKVSSTLECTFLNAGEHAHNKCATARRCKKATGGGCMCS